MQKMAVVRLSLPSTLPSATRKDFWTNYWQSNSPPLPERDAGENERALIEDFGPKLARLLSRADESWRVEIKVRGIRYGFIELMLLVIGGEELLSEMFWTVLEFSAPEAFNETVNGNAPLQPHVPPGQGGGHGGGAVGGHVANRVLTAVRTPLVALILGAVIIIYLLMWRLESLEKEYIELHHDHTSVVNKLTEQNSALITGLMLKLGIPVPPGRDEHKQESKAEPSPPPIASHGEQKRSSPVSSIPSPVVSPPTKTETSPCPSPKVDPSPEGEKRGESH
ncbi:hypothetical protein [Bradyrhizobium sp. B117]|uniref:hypothetical protein n=1 Tax=Bradyrhizobium sp. B117 TaxID=3140246 RepID=UPI00318395F6